MNDEKQQETQLQQPDAILFADAFAKGIHEGLSILVENCKKLVYYIDQCRDVDVRAVILERHPMISKGMLRGFEQVGRGLIHPQLMWDTRPGPGKLKSLPFTLQSKLLSEPVEFLTSTGDTLLLKVENMNTDQAAQVFANGALRDLEEQRAYIEALKSRRYQEQVMSPSANPEWQVHPKKRAVIVNRPCELTASDLARMISEIESRR